MNKQKVNPPIVSYSYNGITNSQYELKSFQEIVDEIFRPDDDVYTSIEFIQSSIEDFWMEGDQKEINEFISAKKKFKISLPHFSMAKFENNYRTNKNFISTEFMILDVDKVPDLNLLRKRLRTDSTVYCFFRSPSGNGLKIIFQFDNPITEEKRFSFICRHYAEKFTMEYGVDVDKIFDAARSCFVSVDPNIYTNYECEKLSIEIDEKDSPNLSDLKFSNPLG